MRYVGTEKVVCPACGVELDVPLYHVNGVNHYGMKFCHQCGNSLFYESDNAEHIGKTFMYWLINSLFHSFCDCNECVHCPFSTDRNGFGVPCAKLNDEQRLQIFKQIYDNKQSED